MGWPQQLDIRLDGKLLKRFTVGGQGKGRPAAASYAGDGEPALRAIPNGKPTCSSPAMRGWKFAFPSRPVRASSASRSCGRCGSRKAFRNPCSSGRVIANDQVYMGYANVGSVEIGGPYDARLIQTANPSTAASRKAIFVCQPPKAAAEERRLRHDDSLRAWPGSPIAAR